jgi:hypothetical protein
MSSSSSSSSSSSAIESNTLSNVEGKTYTKPGQSFPTPSPGSADRVFYESLLREKPDSELALEWCVKHGTALEGTDAQQLFERWNLVKQRKGRKP